MMISVKTFMHQKQTLAKISGPEIIFAETHTSVSYSSPPPPHQLVCLCVVVLLRTEKTCRPGRYGKESRAGSRQDSLLYRPGQQVLSVLTQTHTLTQYRSDRQLGQWVCWCGGAVCCDLQLILIVYRLLVRLSL